MKKVKIHGINELAEVMNHNNMELLRRINKNKNDIKTLKILTIFNILTIFCTKIKN